MRRLVEEAIVTRLRDDTVANWPGAMRAAVVVETGIPGSHGPGGSPAAVAAAWPRRLPEGDPWLSEP